MPLGSRENITLEGDQELKALLRELPARVEKKGLRAAVTAAATPVVKAVKATVPKDTGLLKKSIGKKVKTYSGTAVAIVGAKAGISQMVVTSRGKRKAVPANYFHLVEGGTKPHTESIPIRGGARELVRHPGSRARPALRPAWMQVKPQAERIMENKLAEVVEAEARKLGKL